MKKITNLRISYNSPIILTYVFLSLFVLLLGRNITLEFFTLYPNFSLRLIDFFRLFSYILGHANFSHFFSNISILLLIGPLIEEKYGSKNLLIMIATTALTSAILHITLFHTAILGASGIVFMLILLTPFTNMQSGKIPLTFVLIALIYMGREVFTGVTVSDNVSQFGHILGGTIGAGIGFFMNRKR